MIPLGSDFTLSYDLVYTYSGTISSATTTTGTAVDAQPYEGPIHLFATTGNVGDGSTVITVKMQTASDSAFTTPVDISGTAASKVLAASATANDNLSFMLKGENTLRYVRVAIITLGGTPSVPIAVAVFAKKKGAGVGVLTSESFEN